MLIFMMSPVSVIQQVKLLRLVGLNCTKKFYITNL